MRKKLLVLSTVLGLTTVLGACQSPFNNQPQDEYRQPNTDQQDDGDEPEKGDKRDERDKRRDDGDDD